MNDNELSTMVRESVTDVHSATPIAQIISRGRAVRARRRAPALAGAGAVVAGTALAVTTLVPSGHPGNPLVNARLAAWTVAKQANGDFDVTINQLRDPVGLQSTLRADGVPVRVSYSSHPLPVTRISQHGHPGVRVELGVGPSYHGPLRQDGQAPRLPCKFYAISNDVLNAMVSFPGSTSTHGDTVFLVIKPSLLPAGAGLAMFVGGSIDTISAPSSPPPGTGLAVSSQSVTVNPPDGVPVVEYSVTVSPVYASQQCTG